MKEYKNVLIDVFKLKNTNNINLFNHLYNIQIKRVYINDLIYYLFFHVDKKFLFKNLNWTILNKYNINNVFNEWNNRIILSYYWSKNINDYNFNNIHFNKNLKHMYKNIEKYNNYYSKNNQENENKFYFSIFFRKKV